MSRNGGAKYGDSGGDALRPTSRRSGGWSKRKVGELIEAANSEEVAELQALLDGHHEDDDDFLMAT